MSVVASSSLDSSYKHNRNKKTGQNCGNQTFYRRTEVDGKEVYKWVRMRCKSWKCDTCGPLRAWRLRKAIEEKSRELELTRFLTLTVDPKRIPEGADAVKYLRGQVWAKFRTQVAEGDLSLSFASAP